MALIQISQSECVLRLELLTYCWGIVGLHTIRSDVERGRKEPYQNQRPLFHCHTVGKWWGQSVSCREKQSPVGLLILKQYIYVMFHHLSFWELQVGFFFFPEHRFKAPLRYCVASQSTDRRRVACTVFKIYLLWAMVIIEVHFTFTEAHYYVLRQNIVCGYYRCIYFQ